MLGKFLVGALWTLLVFKFKYNCIFRQFHIFRLVGAIMGTPADVVKARVMNQATDASGRGKHIS